MNNTKSYNLSKKNVELIRDALNTHINHCEKILKSLKDDDEDDVYSKGILINEIKDLKNLFYITFEKF